MSTVSNIPITITPEASAHVAKLGYEREFEEMLEHTLQTIPRIRRIEVSVQDDPEGVDIPVVMIHPFLAPSPDDAEEGHDAAWGKWVVQVYPPQVFEHFVLITFDDHETTNGR